jgi:hypothetical protein
MAMPTGHKSANGYSTVAEIEGGLGYREIAEAMSARGHKMNHSTARNVLVSALSKLAGGVCTAYGAAPDEAQVKRIASDPRFQSGLYEILNK